MNQRLKNVKPETITFLKENTGENLLEISLGSDFFDKTPKAQAMKYKIKEATSN